VHTEAVRQLEVIRALSQATLSKPRLRIQMSSATSCRS
jgi:hypothetical protein